MQTGAQLFTVRMFTQTVEDFQCTIQRVAQMGYRTVQLSAVGRAVRPEIAKRICDECGVKIVITHNDASRILHDTERLIHEHEIMGCKYIGLGCMPEKYQDSTWIGRFSRDFMEPAHMIRDAGMLLMYHNHDLEFEKVGGKYLFDYLLDDFAPDELGITLDTYWVQTAGADVTEWIQKCADRIPCVHLKDRAVVSGRKAIMAPVLEGNMNFRSILKALEKTCCEYALVEQDTCVESPFICLEKSYRNLKALGYE